MSTNLFETASREKYRFVSSKGALTVEQLWDLSLDAIDAVARTINNELKSMSEESFISTRSNPAKSTAENKLELVKQIIATKIAEADARAARVRINKEKAKLLDALASKEEQAVQNLSVDEIRKKLAELDG